MGVTTSRARLDLTREQVLAYRRRVGALDERLPLGGPALRQAAWAGLQDSMPRAAVLSLHARVAGIRPSTWESPGLVQLWGPRYSVFVVPAEDIAVFSLGTLTDAAKGRLKAYEVADRLEAALGGRAIPYGEAGALLGVHPNSLRYAAPTGRVLIRWEGARQPLVWTVPAPAVDPAEARLELARRYLHVYGPTTPEAFGTWSGLGAKPAAQVFGALAPALTPVTTPAGEAWILAADEPVARAESGPVALVRLLPSGDAFYLLQGRDRDLLVPDPGRRDTLWTSRVWPGAVLVAGEVAGTWRRADNVVAVRPWRTLAPAEREAVIAEAEALPLPLARPVSVVWEA